ncbi:serine hydrolase domain-containing protein [Nonomuraea ferruginea]
MTSSSPTRGPASPTRATARPVDGDTLFPVFSVSKALLATAIQLQCERGLVDMDEPVATYWPEYGQRGKERITVGHVLTHRAGVPHMPPDLDAAGLADWDAITSWLAGVEPLHPPGERSMYHSMSFGHILGEVVRRTDPEHRPYDRFLREELCLPIGADDVWDVLPAEHEHRVARLTWGPNPPKRAPMTGVPLLSMPPGDPSGRRPLERPPVPVVVGPGGGRGDDGPRRCAVLQPARQPR